MGHYKFTLYVAGESELAVRALANFDRIIRARLPDRCSLQTVDVLKEPRLARENRVVATPLLVRLEPLPIVKILGDLSHEEKIIAQMGLNGLVGETSRSEESAS